MPAYSARLTGGSVSVYLWFSWSNVFEEYLRVAAGGRVVHSNVGVSWTPVELPQVGLLRLKGAGDILYLVRLGLCKSFV